VLVVAAAATSLYHGAHAGGLLRDTVALPVAQATAMIVLLVFLFLVARDQVGQRVPGGRAVRVFGLATALLAVLWRFAEYRDWMGQEVAVDATMGMFRLPVLTIWALLLTAVFAFPLGNWRVRSPFHTPRPPTVQEVAPIVGTLLTDTYLAFNLDDEDAAFDRLAENLSEGLIADVYLDSRRRLTAGTRKGAEVTVKDVSVMSVDEPSAPGSDDGSFTYPCKWVVTARVRHWQHIHDRQNIYIGTLTIRVEDDRWKIARLELLSEEREVVSWKSS
jgi:hypothetical protein